MVAYRRYSPALRVEYSIKGEARREGKATPKDKAQAHCKGRLGGKVRGTALALALERGLDDSSMESAAPYAHAAAAAGRV